MRNGFMAIFAAGAAASILALAGCSTMEDGGLAGPSREPAPVMMTPKADQPRKTAMTGIGIAPVEAGSATDYMERQAAELGRQLTGIGGAVSRHGATVRITLPADAVFTRATAEVDPKFSPVFDNVASILHQYPATYIDIVGFADSQGSKAFNQSLSEKRANAAAAYLVDHRVQSERIYVAGKGEAEPLASNDTAEGRARNRRVEITLRPMIDR
ncbi:MAG: OmpA family protein [Asticcacaulis sp.]